MSTAIAKNFQVGSDGTATNNFTIRQPATPDGTVRIANGNSGTTTDLVTVTSAGNVGVGTTSPITSFGKSVQIYNDANTGTVASNTYVLVESANRNAVIELAGNAGASNFVNFSDTPGTSVAGIGSFVADQCLVFRTGGVNERFRITSAGDVGIGTSSPGVKLDVNGALRVGLASNPTTIANNSQFYDQSGIGPTISGYNFEVRTGNPTPSSRMIVDSVGNVGIGTSSPGAKLEIGALGVFRMQTGSTVFNTTPTAGATDTLVWNTSNAGSGFAWNTNSAERVRITPAGDVGIGTSSPGAKLEVNGSLRASSVLSTAGMFIVASGSFNNSSANNIGSFAESHIIIHIVTGSNKLSSIPVYPNGGAGVAYVYNYMNPATAAWTNTGGSDMNLTFSCAGSSANTYNVILTAGAGTLTVQRTAGSAAYAVYVQRIASL